MKSFHSFLLILLVGCATQPEPAPVAKVVSYNSTAGASSFNLVLSGTNSPPAPTEDFAAAIAAKPAITNTAVVASVPIVQPSQFVITLAWNIYTNYPACPWVTRWLIVQCSSDLVNWSSVWVADVRWGYTNACITSSNPQQFYRLAVQ